MNNKEKYIAEVDSLRAGDELKNAILEKAQMKPAKSAYKKIIPLAACLVIALLIALPGFVFRAGRAKNATQEVAYDAAVAENEIAAAEENADKKSADLESETDVWYVDYIRNPTRPSEESEIYLSYSYNKEGDYFYSDDKEYWQQGCSFKNFYEQTPGFSVLFVDRLNVCFEYDDKAYMFLIRKGQYGWKLIGCNFFILTSEIPKTNKTDEMDIDIYCCPDKTDWVNMSMDVFRDDNYDGVYEKIISRPYTKYWWCNGYKMGTLGNFKNPLKELVSEIHISFKSEKMALLFTKAMLAEGFKPASSITEIPNDSIVQNETDVYFKWCSVNSEKALLNTNITWKDIFTTTSTAAAPDQTSTDDTAVSDK
ncbi:MAG: DUF4474 domain-containing protein [Clostridia bacterium]|nr:DUF4474 domain-containing protein [Clostridia bacterium]